MVLVTVIASIEEQQANLILEHLNAALAPDRAYEYDDYLQLKRKPQRCVLVDVGRRYTDERRASGEASVKGGRVGTRYVADTMKNARNLRQVVTDVLEDKILTGTSPLAAVEVGPFVFETADPIVPDEGVYSGADAWTY